VAELQSHFYSFVHLRGIELSDEIDSFQIILLAVVIGIMAYMGQLKKLIK
jgi:hypothetical protein